MMNRKNNIVIVDNIASNIVEKAIIILKTKNREKKNVDTVKEHKEVFLEKIDKKDYFKNNNFEETFVVKEAKKVVEDYIKNIESEKDKKEKKMEKDKIEMKNIALKRILLMIILFLIAENVLLMFR